MVTDVPTIYSSRELTFRIRNSPAGTTTDTPADNDTEPIPSTFLEVALEPLTTAVNEPAVEL